MTLTTSSDGLDLIKHFECCHLKAYYCPSNILTIGWGHTGPDVKEGKSITQQQADDFLVSDIKRFEKTVNDSVTVEIKQNMFDSLVSFTYNCGSDAFRNSTLLRLLNSSDYEGAAGQFSRWVNGPNGPLPGLVTRREFEEKLFKKNGYPDGTSESKPKIIANIKARNNTVLKKEPTDSSSLSNEQKVSIPEGKEYGLVWMGQEADNHVKVSLAYNGGNWFIFAPHWDGIQSQSTSSSSGGRVLPVRYFSQRDNYRDASRTCFSSSCAMLLEYLKPGTLPGERGDDKYVQTVFGIGDTTEQWVQVSALKKYGVASRFVQNGSVDLLKREIDSGKPVPIGILHKGPSSAPSGGGHWICVIGYDESGFICHDPWGKLNDTTGNYDSTNGSSVHYSNSCIKRRWTVAHPNDGWCVLT